MTPTAPQVEDVSVPLPGSRRAAGPLVVILGLMVIMVDGFDLQAIGFVAPEIARSWSMDIAAFGPVFSAALAGSILGALIAGPMSRLMGARLAMAASLLLFGGLTLATAWARDLTALVVLRFVVGIGLGAAIPLVLSLVAANSPVRWRATLMVVTMCGQPIGSIAGGALCAQLMPIYGWPFAFHLGGVLPLLLAPVVLAFPNANFAPAPAAGGQGPAEGRFASLFGRDRRAVTLLLALGSLMAVSSLYLVVNWLPGSLRSAGYSLQMSVLAISLYNFGGIAGALVLGALMDRFGPFRVILPTYAVAAVSLALLDVATHFPALLLTVAALSGLTACAGGMVFGSLTALLHPPALRTTGLGFVLGVGRTGAALSPMAAGAALAAGLALGKLFYFSGFAALVVMLSLLLLARVLRAAGSADDGR